MSLISLGTPTTVAITFLSLAAPRLSLPYSKATINLQGYWSRKHFVEAVLYDGHSREDRQPQQGDGDDHDAGRRAPEADQTAHTDAADHDRAPVGEPLYLPALLAPRTAHPNDKRDGRRHHGAPRHDGACSHHYLQYR